MCDDVDYDELFDEELRAAIQWHEDRGDWSYVVENLTACRACRGGYIEAAYLLGIAAGEAKFPVKLDNVLEMLDEAAHDAASKGNFV